MRRRLSWRGLGGFTLIELLVVVAIVSILAAILFPVFARAKDSAKKAVCSSNLRQIGLVWGLYLADYDDRMPDRRDLKLTAEGGFRPWAGWPPSDPRAGWLVELVEVYEGDDILSCPSTAALWGREARVTQNGANYWLWRFDQVSEPVPLDNWWGKTPDQAVADLVIAANRFVGIPSGVSQAELAVDPFFPRANMTIPASIRGRAVHFGGRNRLFLDGHVKFLRDPRTD